VEVLREAGLSDAAIDRLRAEESADRTGAGGAGPAGGERESGEGWLTAAQRQGLPRKPRSFGTQIAMLFWDVPIEIPRPPR